MISFQGMQFRPSACFDRLAEVDWSATPVGPPDNWSAALKTSVQLCLNSRLPMSLSWGAGHVIFYNDAYLPVMGEQHPGGFGRPVSAVWPESAGFLAGRLRDLMSRGEVSYEDHMLLPRQRDGVSEEAYFTFSFSPVSDERGVIAGVLCIASDTTEAALQQRRGATIARLADDMARLPAQQPLAPLVRRAVGANPLDFARVALCAITGTGQIQPFWSSPRNFADSLPRQDRLLDHLASHRGSKHAAVLALGDGCHALVLEDEAALGDSAYAMVVEPGELVRNGDEYVRFLNLVLDTVVGAVYRIFAERRAYRAVTRQLSDRDRMYRLLFEQSRDGIMLMDASGRVSAANPAACRLLGYSEGALVGLGRNDVVLDDDGTFTAALQQYRESGSFNDILRFRRSDGSVLVADVSAALFSDRLIGNDATIALFRDATRRLANQERLAATARLEAIGQLTGGISHDFNNLLNVIIHGAEDVVEHLPKSDHARRSADLVLEASLKAAHLTRQLLAFGRRQPLAARALDVRDTLQEVDQILGRAIGEAINVQIESAEDVYAFADPSQLQNAVLNLCINARDAMPDGGRLLVASELVTLDAGTAGTLSLEPGPYVRIAVTDTGVGIAREHVNRVVEPFYTTKPAGAGTGLGLSMVFGFVNQSGGGMRLNSEPGRGTTVELYLPPASAEHSEPEPAPRPLPLNPPQDPSAHLLVVEDNELLASMLVRVLEGAGYQVSLCGNAETALELMERERGVSLVVTDIQLGPGMDGWALAERILGHSPHVPVVTMSGFAPGDEAGGAARLPTLRKPFRPREILTLINEQLARPAAGGRPAGQPG